MNHQLKIKPYLINQVLEGSARSIGVRREGRDFQAGDTLHFEPVTVRGLPLYLPAPIPSFTVTSTHSGLGVSHGYIILGIEPVKENIQPPVVTCSTPCRDDGHFERLWIEAIGREGKLGAVALDRPKLPAAQFIFMEQHYKAGILSNLKIAKSIGMSEAFVRKWAKRLGWERTLHRDVMRKAQEKLAQTADPHRESHVTFDGEAVDTASDMVVAVVREQRGVLGNARKLAEQFVKELAILSEYPEEMDRIAQIVAIEETMDEESARKRLATFRKILNLDGRTKTLTNLAMALSRVIEAERKAFNLDGEMGGAPNDGKGLGGVMVEDFLLAVIEHDKGQDLGPAKLDLIGIDSAGNDIPV